MSDLIVAAKGDLADVIKANLGDVGLDMSWAELDRIATPRTKAFTWTNALGEDRSEKVLKGVIVGTRKGGVLWQTSVPQKGQPPVLRSDDGVTANLYNEKLGDNDKSVLDEYRLADGVYDWQGLVTKSAYGRPPKGDGRCKEYTDIAFLLLGELFPVVLRITAGSNRKWQAYNRGLIGAMKKHHEVITEWKIVEEESRGGQPYLGLAAAKAGDLSENDAEALFNTYVKPLA